MLKIAAAMPRCLGSDIFLLISKRKSAGERNLLHYLLAAHSSVFSAACGGSTAAGAQLIGENVQSSSWRSNEVLSLKGHLGDTQSTEQHQWCTALTGITFLGGAIRTLQDPHGRYGAAGRISFCEQGWMNEAILPLPSIISCILMSKHSSQLRHFHSAKTTTQNTRSLMLW